MKLIFEVIERENGTIDMVVAPENFGSDNEAHIIEGASIALRKYMMALRREPVEHACAVDALVNAPIDGNS